MTRPLRRLTILSALCVLAVAAPAHAGQIVYPSGTGIWVMNDDGSAKRELVDVSQVPSMEHLGDPSVQPNGTEVAFVGRWDQAYYEQNHWGPAPGMCGGNCEGVYELVNGTASRITNAPFDCGAQPCQSQETDPRVARDGSVAYVFQTWVSEMGGSGWMPIQGQSDLLARDGAGANQTRWPTACDGTSAAGKEITDADVLAVNPLIPGQIAYANCRETANDGSCVVDWTTAYDVIDSGASQGSAADDVTYHSVTDPSAQCLRDAGTQIGDIDFSPDATHMVELHGGNGAGIYTYAASHDGGASAAELLALPSGWTFYSVRYIGSGRIGFTAGTSTDKIGLYTMPTTCTPASCNVASGAGVTNLTGTSYVSADYVLNSAGFSYTSSGSAIKAVATAPPPPCTSCTPPPPPPPCTTCTQTSKLTATVARIRAQHLATLMRRGLTVTASCSGACALKASLMLKHAALGTVSRSLRGRGSAKLVLRLSRAGRAKLKNVHNAKLTLVLVASDRAGHRRTLTRTFKLTK
ncbi:MAG: hypothetical protein ACXVRW_02305 [Solirubrobacteraceae bacterium]